jgi:hypothetical protein
MTSPIAPPEPWDDRRLEAAFAVRASTARTPPELVDAALDRVRPAPRPAPLWQRWLPAAAVIVLAVGVAAGGIALSDQVRGRALFRPGPSADLKTLDNGAFAFDYPAAWLAYDASAAGSGVSSIAVLGTLPVERRCGNERHVDINCVYQQRLDAGHIRLFVMGAAYRGGTIQDRPDIENGTTTRTWVGGMPAIFDESDDTSGSYYREDESLSWEIARPRSGGTNVVRLEALLTEPGAAEARRQLDALVASFRFTNGPDPSVPPTPAPTPTEAPPRLSDLRVMTVEQLIAAAESPTSEEVVLRGWLARSSAVVDCTLRFPRHPLQPQCDENYVYLLSEEETVDGLGADTPLLPHVVPRLGTDMHIEMDFAFGRPVEVQAIGHLADHRWTTCSGEAQIECKRRFVIDRVVPADQPIADDIPEPWTSPSDHPVGGVDDAVEVLSSVVGGITVLSIGVADIESLRSIEPQVQDINNGEGAWVIRALVGGDTLPIPRTFLVGHIGWWTLFEVTESGVIERTPPVEAAPTAVATVGPDRSFPPRGSIVVFLAKDGGFELPRFRAALVDLSGRVTAVRAPRPDEPRLIGLVGEGPGFLTPHPTVPDRYQLVWTGGMCDGDTVITIDGELRTVRVEATQDGGCDAIGVERRLVIDIDGPLDPRAVEVRYTETSAGAS